jgi:thymidylate kinase
MVDHDQSGERRSSARSAGSFVVLVGPDGVGKTSLARGLLEHWPGPTLYFHFMPSPDSPFTPTLEGHDPVPPPKAPPTGSMVLGWVRLVRNFVRFWVAYLFRIRPETRGGALVIGDRWLYGYVAQPTSLRFYGPAWLGSLAVRLMPHPDLIINLTAAPDVIHERKDELSVEQITRELSLWKTLPSCRRRDVDAGESAERVLDVVMAIISPEGRAA